MTSPEKNEARRKETFIPVAGMRFTYNGNEYEIGHVAFADVRYNAVAGGRNFRMPTARLQEMVAAGDITISRDSQQIAESPYLRLTADELDGRLRQLRYAQGARTQLSKPTARGKLTEWVTSYAERLNDSKVPGASSVARWVKALRDYGEEHFLRRPQRSGNPTLRFVPGVEQGIQEGLADYMSAEKRTATNVLAHVHGYLLEQNIYGQKVPSVRTLRRRINKIDPYLLIRVKQGSIAAQRATRAGGRAHLSHMPMFIVQIDSHVCDVLVVDEATGDVIGRPILVLAIDVRTRCVVGWHLSMNPPSATTTLAAVKDMFTRPLRGLPGGIPVHLIPDNGVEFKNTPVMRLLIKAGVILEPAKIREPNDKPHVESFFRTFTKSLSHMLPGTTFSNPTERGQYKSEDRACLTLDQVKGYAEHWIEEVYHKTIHTSTGRAPIMMWKEETGEGKVKPLAMTEDEVNVIARTPVRSTINKGRVRHDHLAWFSHALRTVEHTHKGQVTVLIDDLDLSRAYVEDPREKGAYIVADSTTPEYTKGLTRSAHRAAREQLEKLSPRDKKELGKDAALFGLYKLMQEIQKDSAFARKQIKRLREGKKALDERAAEVKKVMDDSTTVLSSQLQQAAGISPEWIDPVTGEILIDGHGPQPGQHFSGSNDVSHDDGDDGVIIL